MSKQKTLSVVAELNEGFAVSATIRGHQVLIDQPQAAGGNDQAPNPLELFLFSLGGCVASIARIKASQDRINLRSIKVLLDASLNPAVLMGKPSDDRCGFDQITIQAEIDADLSESEKKAFLDEVCARCPLHDNIAHSTEVVHRLAR